MGGNQKMKRDVVLGTNEVKYTAGDKKGEIKMVDPPDIEVKYAGSDKKVHMGMIEGGIEVKSNVGNKKVKKDREKNKVKVTVATSGRKIVPTTFSIDSLLANNSDRKPDDEMLTNVNEKVKSSAVLQGITMEILPATKTFQNLDIDEDYDDL